MVIDKETRKRVETMLNTSYETINYNNFAYLSVECLIEDIIDMLIERKCNINDINLLCELLPKRLLKCEIKKGDKMPPSF